MKDHLRSYFPERFDDSPADSFWSKVTDQFGTDRLQRQKNYCEQKVEKICEKSNEVKLLIKAMKKYGCNFSLDRHIVCEVCNNCEGGYDPDTNQIVICQGKKSQNRILSTIVHEMIHMFDVCRAKFDFNNLEHVACTEVRASNLTYCGLEDRMRFGGPLAFQLRESHQYCVKDVALQSLESYSPETDKEKLRQIVEKVFPYCYNDLEPFGRRPMIRSINLRHSYRERFFMGYD